MVFDKVDKIKRTQLLKSKIGSNCKQGHPRGFLKWSKKKPDPVGSYVLVENNKLFMQKCEK